jgi:diacylglycerol kinase (ATP)
MFKRVHVIANPAAGQDQPILGVLNSAFQNANMEWELFLTKQAGDALRLASEALEMQADVVAVYGGDGTVMEVASALKGTNVPLAILPGGTANVMSIELGIPGNLADAVALICSDTSTVRVVDMATVGNHPFLLRVATGFSAEMTKGTEREAKNRMGTLAYIFSALRALPNAQVSKYHLILDGQEIESEGVTCIIANSGNLGLPGLKLAKVIDVSDGLLDVFVIRSADLNALLSVAANAIGIAEALPHWQAREVNLAADPPQVAECDGEIIDPTPLHVSIVPQALHVVVPKTAVPENSPVVS